MPHAPVTTRRAVLAAGLAGAGALALPQNARAGEDPVFSDWRGRAIRGYDPVAYFTQGRAVRGDSDFEARWKGASWRFASAENRDLFLADPERYAPQYGGWCAWAVSEGSVASVDPEQWTITDGKLYLNYNPDIQRRWRADMAERIRRADAQWPGVLE